MSLKCFQVYMTEYQDREVCSDFEGQHVHDDLASIYHVLNMF